ncbi:hypothetical protein [Anaerosalibacter sp. Marseille-P3206]|uniref:hypothetical protein n=1 Tax=Anaerosalibacter sp. Marseille-P3206 TaxID=1871005 RepID=UPI00098584D3|nr:hypothetical protein [Anaerosalibacter sp. Marseille-P3206]
MNKPKLLISLTILLVIFAQIFGQVNLSFATNAKDKTAYLIVVNKYTLEDIDKMPNLKKIIEEGSIGLMNTRGLYSYSGPESYLTINSSKKAFTTTEGAEFYNLNQNSMKVYERRFGKIYGEFSIANLDLSKIIKHNENNSYKPYIGALGDNLHNANLKTAVFGNADIVDKISRYSSLIPMDSKGLIDFGNVQDTLIDVNKYPFGFRTDYEKLIEEVNAVKEDASLIVIDTGDLDRLSSYSSELTDEMFEKHRHNIIEKIDGFFGELKRNIDKDNSLLIILSPNRCEERIDKSKLTPLVCWGEGVDKGICTSATTKRDGVVANIDIGPTILEYLGASKEHMSGNSLVYITKEDSFNYITSILNRINIVSNSRFNILTIYSIIIIIGIIFATMLLALKIKIKGNLYRILKFFLIVIGILPISFILSSLFKWESYISNIITIILLSVILVFIFYKLRNTYTVLLISGAIYTLIVVDVMTGGNLIRYSALGHDPAIGARYFGLGNELVGLFLGVTVIFTSMIINKTGKKSLSYLLLILSGILVGYPKLGANVGGSIAILFAILYFIVESMDIDINLRKIFGIGIGVIVFILIMAFIDIRFNPNPTHLGRMILEMNSEGKSIANNIIIRKILMNIKLVGSSIWTKVLFVNMFSQGLILITWGDSLRQIFKDKKYVYIGLSSGVVGSIMGFLANDSGIILASIAMVFITLFFIYTLIDHILKEYQI